MIMWWFQPSTYSRLMMKCSMQRQSTSCLGKWNNIIWPCWHEHRRSRIDWQRYKCSDISTILFLLIFVQLGPKLKIKMGFNHHPHKFFRHRCMMSHDTSDDTNELIAKFYPSFFCAAAFCTTKIGKIIEYPIFGSKIFFLWSSQGGVKVRNVEISKYPLFVSRCLI